MNLICALFARRNPAKRVFSSLGGLSVWSERDLPWSARDLPWSERGLSPTFSLFFYFGRTVSESVVRPFACFPVLVGLLSDVLSDLLSVFPFWSALLRFHNPTFWQFSHFGRSPLGCVVRPFACFSILVGLSPSLWSDLLALFPFWSDSSRMCHMCAPLPTYHIYIRVYSSHVSALRLAPSPAPARTPSQ